MARQVLTFDINTSRIGVLHTSPSSTDLALFSGGPFVRQRFLNLISWAKKAGVD